MQTGFLVKNTPLISFKNLFKNSLFIFVALLSLQSCASSVRFSSGGTSPGSGSSTSSDGKTGGGTSVPAGSIFRGFASYYADKFHGRTTATGKVFDQEELTAQQ